ncbi:MAG: enoyl-CoA hydratase-related protein, partial [Bacteroidota bacterium]
MNKNNIGLEVHQEEDILWVGIHRPAKRNAINDALIQGLEETFSQIPDGVKCAIIYGIGEHFSAGLDLSELSERDAVAGLHHSRMWHKA